MKTNRDKVTIFPPTYRPAGHIILFSSFNFFVSQGKGPCRMRTARRRTWPENIDPQPGECQRPETRGAPEQHPEDSRGHDDGRCPHPQAHDYQGGEHHLDERDDDEHGRAAGECERGIRVDDLVVILYFAYVVEEHHASRVQAHVQYGPIHVPALCDPFTDSFSMPRAVQFAFQTPVRRISGHAAPPQSSCRAKDQCVWMISQPPDVAAV